MQYATQIKTAVAVIITNNYTMAVKYKYLCIICHGNTNIIYILYYTIEYNQVPMTNIY